jgi:hypothetical protein
LRPVEEEEEMVVVVVLVVVVVVVMQVPWADMLLPRVGCWEGRLKRGESVVSTMALLGRLKGKPLV